MTIIANFLTRFSGEYLLALLTMAKHTALREMSCGVKKRMFQPKITICFAMTLMAKCFQIIQCICLKVTRKQSKRYFMINDKFSYFATFLAPTIGFFKHQFFLLLPICTPIVNMTTSPSGVLISSELTFARSHSDIIA